MTLAAGLAIIVLLPSLVALVLWTLDCAYQAGYDDACADWSCTRATTEHTRKGSTCDSKS